MLNSTELDDPELEIAILASTEISATRAELAPKWSKGDLEIEGRFLYLYWIGLHDQERQTSLKGMNHQW